MATVLAMRRDGLGVPPAFANISARGQTVTVVLRTRSASFVDRFGVVGAGMVPYVLEGGRARPNPAGPIIGAGPFRVNSANSDRLQVIAYEQYYRGNARWKTIEVVTFADSNSRRNALRTANIDMTASPLIAPVNLASYGEKTKTYLRPFAGVELLYFATWRPPMNDRRVRRAFALATNREFLVDKVYHRQAIAAIDYAATGRWVDRPSRDELRPHLAEAEKLPEDAGWHRNLGGVRERDGMELELTSSCNLRASKPGSPYNLCSKHSARGLTCAPFH